MSTGPGTYHLALLPSMAAVHPWFHTSLLKRAGPQPARPPALVDDSYEVETILHINKSEIHTKIKCMGYDSSQKQCIRLSELKNTAIEVVKTFLRRERQERVRLRLRKRTQDIVLMHSLAGFYVCKLVKVKVKNSWVTKLNRLVKHSTQACSCIFFYVLCYLWASLLISPLGETEGSQGVSPSIGYLILWKAAWFILTSVMNVICC